MKYSVGLDWAKEAHAVRVLDSNGGVVDRFKLQRDRKGLAGLKSRLRHHASPRNYGTPSSGLLVGFCEFSSKTSEYGVVVGAGSLPIMDLLRDGVSSNGIVRCFYTGRGWSVCDNGT